MVKPPSGDRTTTRSLLRRISKKPVTSRLVNTKGGFNVIRLGETSSRWRDLYHLLLTLSWPSFFGLLALLYGLANIFFALLYALDPNGIANARPGSLVDAFFFSVQTMASIGYGAMYPQTLYTHVIVTIESLVGLLGLAMGTGLMFSRFSRPTAKVLFSRVAVIAPFEGQPTLMFRVANQRRNQILEAQINVTLVRNQVDAQGRFMRRFYDLKLVRSRTPIFALTWMAMHPIDEESPLYQLTPADYDEAELEIIVTLTGLDETFAQTIHARHSYIPSEILWERRFVDILAKTADGRRTVDYSHFHDTVDPHL